MLVKKVITLEISQIWKEKKLWIIYDNEFENLNEMVKLLEKHNFLKLTQEEVEYWNSPEFTMKLNTWLKFKKF